MANEIGAQGFTGARVGFAKIPPPSAATAAKPESDDADYYHQTAAAMPASSTINGQPSATEGGSTSSLMQDATVAWQNDLFNIMCQFNVNDTVARNFVKGKLYSWRGFVCMY